MIRTQLLSRRTLLIAIFVAVLAISGVVFTYRLGANAINGDEAIHTMVTRAMRESGDWLNMRLADLDYFRKPPLAFWIRAAVQNVFSENEFTNRIPSALAGIATTLLLSWWGWEWTRKKSVALLVGVLYPLLPIHFVHTFREGLTDGLFIFLTTLTAYVFWKSLRNPRLIIAVAALTGFAFMTKNVAAFVLPAAGLVTLLIIRWWPYTWRQSVISIALFCAIALPWHVQQLAVHGGAFWDEYVGFHIVERTTTRIHISPKLHGPFWYFANMEKMMFPWAWLLLPAGAYACAHAAKARRRQAGYTRGTADILLLAWGVGTFTVFSIAATKLNWYIAPAYPAFMLLIARFLTVPIRRMPWWIVAVFGGSFVGYWWRLAHTFRDGTTGFFAMNFFGPRASTALVTVAVLGLIILAVRRTHATTLVLKICFLLAVIHMVIYAISDTYHALRTTMDIPSRVFDRALRATQSTATVLIGDPKYGVNYPAQYYLGGPKPQRTIISFTPDQAELATMMRDHPGSAIILPSSFQLSADLTRQLRLLSTFGTFALYVPVREAGTMIR